MAQAYFEQDRLDIDAFFPRVYSILTLKGGDFLEELKKLTIRIPERLHYLLKAKATLEGQTVTSILERFINEYVGETELSENATAFGVTITEELAEGIQMLASAEDKSIDSFIVETLMNRLKGE